MTEGLQWYHCIEVVSVSDSAATELSHYTDFSGVDSGYKK